MYHSVYLIFTEMKYAAVSWDALRCNGKRAEADVKMNSACRMNKTDSALLA